ncbi:hypothetical protein DFH28DRAFT_1030892 [Melampsora americana]|nr:hypothetical protein DFH28DRAFT_1030892 [Melampsora americana]
MRPVYLPFWAFFIYSSKQDVHGFPHILYDTMETNGEGRSMMQYDQPKEVFPKVLGSFIPWKGSMMKILDSINAHRTRYKKAKVFWEEYNSEYVRQRKHQSLIRSMNNLILSKTSTWHNHIKKLLLKERGHDHEQTVIFQFLKKLVDFYEIPYETVQRIQNEIIISSSFEIKSARYLSQAWKKGVDSIINLYDAQLKEKIPVLEQRNKPGQLGSSLADKTRVFWEEYEEYFHEKRLNPALIKSLNNLLLSNPHLWDLKVQRLFQQAMGNGFEQIVIFRFLRKLVDFHEATLYTLQAVYNEILDVASSQVWERIYFEDWNDELELTQKVYEKQLEHKIMSLEPGVFKILYELIITLEPLNPSRELTEFLANQEVLAHLGMRLQGNWPPVYQKFILLFFVTHRDLYLGVNRNPRLQHVLEAEIVQTQLIETVQKFPQNGGKLEDVYMNWASSEIKTQSDIIVTYIKSINTFRASYDFMITQFDLKPYGLKVTPSTLISNEIIIIQFWSSYVQVFLKTKSLGETPSLQAAIGVLVKNNFKETSEIMKQFLIDIDGQDFTQDQHDPVLAQFLQYFSQKTIYTNQHELAVEALREFKKEFPIKLST